MKGGVVFYLGLLLGLIVKLLLIRQGSWTHRPQEDVQSRLRNVRQTSFAIRKSRAAVRGFFCVAFAVVGCAGMDGKLKTVADEDPTGRVPYSSDSRLLKYSVRPASTSS